MSKTFAFQPVDAWFFGDSQPYHKKYSDQANVRSVFPPYAYTVVGAIRYAAARGLGWNGRERWPEEITKKLGDGMSLGPLAFHGPMILRKTDDGWERLFRAPFHLLGREKDDAAEASWTPKTLLILGEGEVRTDAGLMRMPRKADPDCEHVKGATGIWMTAGGLARVMVGEVPKDDNQWEKASEMWRIEHRVALARDYDTRGAREGELYSPAYVRLEKKIGVGMTVNGLSEDCSMPGQVLFGGESRMARIDAAGEDVTVPELPDAAREGIADGRVAVILLTPLRLDRNVFDDNMRPGMVLESEQFGGLRGCKLICACAGKPEWIGGWDSENREPLDLKPHVPAGSVFFVELPDAVSAEDVMRAHGTKIGKRTDFGFGEIVLGTWKEN